MKEAVENHVLPIDDRGRAHQRRRRRASRPDAGPHTLTVYRGHGRHDRERLHQHQEPLASRSRPKSRFRRAAQWRDPGPGGPVRRLEPVLKDGKPTYVTIISASSNSRSPPTSAARGQGDDSLRLRL